MIRKKIGELQWLEYELFQPFPELKHALFLRHGGVSSFPFSSLNAGGSTGDLPEAVEENRRRMMQLFPQGTLVSAHQVHGPAIEWIDESPFFEERCDALMTKCPKKALMIKHADCQAALFYDPVEKIVAHVHCGWRGNVQNIYQKTVEAFKSQGSLASNLFVGISPSLGPLHAEFIHYKEEFPPSFQEFLVQENRFDLWALSEKQLQEAGVLRQHIECAFLCTYQNEKDYFSYRREKHTGRHASIAMLL